MKNAKKLLMLGGSDIQISAISIAKELGYYVITADYLPNNPGHAFSDEYHNVSTTDKDKILELATRLKIDGISSYASDPGALTAAYVSEKLGLSGNSFASVLTLSDKCQFRQAQKEVAIPAPEFTELSSVSEGVSFLQKLGKKAIIKPVDCSGSKGIHIVENGERLEEALIDALSFSRAKKVIIEEYIPREGFLMSGDILVEKGKIIFNCFGDVHFNDHINGLVPRSISLPASKQKGFFDQMIIDIEKLFNHLGIQTGAFNIDVIENCDGNPVLIDIGARNGGNMLNNIIHRNTGYDLIRASVQQCMSDDIEFEMSTDLDSFTSHYVVHSDKDGEFQSIDFSEWLREHAYYSKINPKPGDKIHRFLHSGCRLGLLLIRYDSFYEMHTLLASNFSDHITINLKE